MGLGLTQVQPVSSRVSLGQTETLPTPLQMLSAMKHSCLLNTLLWGIISLIPLPLPPAPNRVTFPSTPQSDLDFFSLGPFEDQSHARQSSNPTGLREQAFMAGEICRKLSTHAALAENPEFCSQLPQLPITPAPEEIKLSTGFCRSLHSDEPPP